MTINQCKKGWWSGPSIEHLFSKHEAKFNLSVLPKKKKKKKDVHSEEAGLFRTLREN
jgi:hypothetical protein